MAEVTAMRNNALPYPIYGAPWTVLFPLLDADGDPVAPSSPDSEISKNGDTAADCTNEAVEIVNGSCYLILTGTELTCDAALVQVKSTGAKTTVLTLYPRKLVTIHSGTAADDGSGTGDIVLDSGASAIDDFYNGMVCIATIDGNIEARVISDYAGSTKTATVVPDWNVAPDSNDTFVIKLPEGHQFHQANVTHAANTAWNSGAISASTLASDTIAAAKIASGAITSAKFAAGAIDATAIADNAIDAGAIASDAITAAKIANGAIDASTFAAGAIDAAALAADAGTEIATAVWASAARSLTVLDEDSTTLDLDATIRAAVGLAAANLDTQLATIDTNVDSILADTGTDGVVVDAASKTGYRLSATGVDDIHDEVVEGAVTLRQSIRLANSALGGKASGLETTNAKYRNLGDSKDRIDATVDVDGNRTAVTLDLT